MLAANPDACDFGRWLAGFTPAAADRVHHETCRELHATFHAQAAKTLHLVSTGQQTQAQSLMSPRGDFTTASTTLTEAMTRWRQSKK